MRVSPPPSRPAPRPAVSAASRGPGGWWRPVEGAHRSRDSLVPELCSSAAEAPDVWCLTGSKRAIFRPFPAAGGAKTRSVPQLRSTAGGPNILLTCPGPVAGRRGRHGGARGRKDENPHFRYLFEEGVGLEPDFRAFFRLKSVTKLISTF